MNGVLRLFELLRQIRHRIIIMTWRNNRLIFGILTVFLIPGMLILVFAPTIIFLLRKNGIETASIDSLVKTCIGRDFDSGFTCLINIYPLFIILAIAYKHGLSTNNEQFRQMNRKADYIKPLLYIATTAFAVISIIISMQPDVLAEYNKDNAYKWFYAEDILKFPIDQYKRAQITDTFYIENIPQASDSIVHVFFVDKTGSIDDDAFNALHNELNKAFENDVTTIGRGIQSLPLVDKTLFFILKGIDKQKSSKCEIHIYNGEKYGRTWLNQVDGDLSVGLASLYNAYTQTIRTTRQRDPKTSIDSLLFKINEVLDRLHETSTKKIHVHILSDFFDDYNPNIPDRALYEESLEKLAKKAYRFSIISFQSKSSLTDEITGLTIWRQQYEQQKQAILEKLMQVPSALNESEMRFLTDMWDLDDKRWKRTDAVLESLEKHNNKVEFTISTETQAMRKAAFIDACRTVMEYNDHSPQDSLFFVNISTDKGLYTLERQIIDLENESNYPIQESPINFYSPYKKGLCQNTAQVTIDFTRLFAVNYSAAQPTMVFCCKNIKADEVIKMHCIGENNSKDLLANNYTICPVADSHVTCTINTDYSLLGKDLNLIISDKNSNRIRHHKIVVTSILFPGLSLYLALFYSILVSSISLMVFLSCFIHLFNNNHLFHTLKYIGIICVVISFNIWYCYELKTLQISWQNIQMPIRLYIMLIFVLYSSVNRQFKRAFSEQRSLWLIRQRIR
jgi:hypothetical protein